MKKILLVCVLSASLFSCSLLQRRDADSEPTEANNEEQQQGADAPLFDANGKEVVSGGNANESEISRLNTKVAALETKLDVMSSNMERLQAQRAQPVIVAETKPQANLAAPVDESQPLVAEQNAPTEVSAAPAKPAMHLPAEVVAEPAANAAAKSGAERDFRSGMQLFQNGQNLEAASKFALMAKKFPHHLLAAHALYWAGEASARAQQWQLATENWSDLEKRYPRSTYLPEALAGLAKAYDAQGDATKGKYYRTVLQRAFPKSPVALKAESESDSAPVATNIHRNSAGASAPTAAEEAAPEFLDQSSSEPESAGESQ